MSSSYIWIHWTDETDVLPQDLVKSRNYEIECYNDQIALKFDILR